MAKISFPIKNKREKKELKEEDVLIDVEIFSRKNDFTEKVETPIEEVKMQIKEEKKPWLKVGLLVKINNKEVGNGRYNKLTALIKDNLTPPESSIIKELKKSTKEYSTCALVLLLRNDNFNGDILQVDQEDLIPLPPTPSTKNVQVLNKHHKHGGETVKLISIISTEAVEVELRNHHRLILPQEMITQFIE